MPFKQNIRSFERKKRNEIIRSYWDHNTDPFNWRRVVPAEIQKTWKKAVYTFLAPDVCHAIVRMAPLHGKRLLFLSSGFGQGAVHLAKMGGRVFGLDTSKMRCRSARKLIRTTEQKAHVYFVTADAQNIPFKNGFFDAVLSQDLLMYADSASVVSEVQRILMPGGKAVFIESTAGHPIVSLFRHCCDFSKIRPHTRPLKWRELKAVGLEKLKLREIRGFYFFSIPAFGALYFFRSIKGYQFLLSILYPIDTLINGLLPSLVRFNWKGVACYQKTDSTHQDEPVERQLRGRPI